MFSVEKNFIVRKWLSKHKCENLIEINNRTLLVGPPYSGKTFSYNEKTKKYFNRVLLNTTRYPEQYTDGLGTEEKN